MTVEYAISYTLDYLYWELYRPNFYLIRSVVVAFILWKVITFAWAVWCKRRWIRAALQHLSNEMTRVEILSTREELVRVRKLMGDFVLDGLPRVREASRSLITVDEAANDNTGEILFKAADWVNTEGWNEWRQYVGRLRLLRHVLDGLDALIGDWRSIDTAWGRGLSYIDEYANRSIKDANAPWIHSYLKALSLPWNRHSSTFAQAAAWAASRTIPRGYFSLWVACVLFNYKRRLRYGALVKYSTGDERWVEHTGEEAWQMMLTYKQAHHLRIENIENARG